MRTDHFLGWTPAGHKIWDGLDGLGFSVDVQADGLCGMICCKWSERLRHGLPSGNFRMSHWSLIYLLTSLKMMIFHSLWWVYQRVTIQHFFFQGLSSMTWDFHLINRWNHTRAISTAQVSCFFWTISMDVNGISNWSEGIYFWSHDEFTSQHENITPNECSVLDSTAINCPLANSTRIASSSQILRQSWSVGIHQRWFQDSSKQ